MHVIKFEKDLELMDNDTDQGQNTVLKDHVLSGKYTKLAKIQIPPSRGFKRTTPLKQNIKKGVFNQRSINRVTFSNKKPSQSSTPNVKRTMSKNFNDFSKVLQAYN